jgi:PAS domain-containing protein
VLTSKLPLYDDAGNIVGTFGISRDITSLKRAEMQLQQERNLLRSLIDTIPDYVYIKDRQQPLCHQRTGALRLLGARSRRGNGKNDLTFSHATWLSYYADTDVENPGNPC